MTSRCCESRVKFISFTLIKLVQQELHIIAPLLLLAIFPFLLYDKLPTLWPLIIHQGNRPLLCEAEGEIYYSLIFNCKDWHIVSGTNKSELCLSTVEAVLCTFTRASWKSVSSQGCPPALAGRCQGYCSWLLYLSP